MYGKVKQESGQRNFFGEVSRRGIVINGAKLSSFHVLLQAYERSAP